MADRDTSNYVKKIPVPILVVILTFGGVGLAAFFKMGFAIEQNTKDILDTELTTREDSRTLLKVVEQTKQLTVSVDDIKDDVKENKKLMIEVLKEVKKW